MTVDEVIEYYGNISKACRSIGLTKQAGWKWKNKGYIPWFQQYRFSEATDGALKPDKVDPHIEYLRKKNDAKRKT